MSFGSVEKSPDRIPSIFKVSLCCWYLYSLILLWTTGSLAVGRNGDQGQGQGLGDRGKRQGKTNCTSEKYYVSEHKQLNLFRFCFYLFEVLCHVKVAPFVDTQ